MSDATKHASCLSDWPPADDERADALTDLKDALDELVAHPDAPDDVRSMVALMAVSMALLGGLKAGVRADAVGVLAFVELPTGQVSFRLPAHEREHDGHVTEEQRERVRAFLAPINHPV